MALQFSFLERYRQRGQNSAVGRQSGKSTNQLSRHVYARRSPLVIDPVPDDPGAIVIRQVVDENTDRFPYFLQGLFVNTIFEFNPAPVFFIKNTLEFLIA